MNRRLENVKTRTMRTAVIAIAAMVIAVAGTIPAIAVENGNNDHKVTICHVPPGNPNNPQTISIDESAVEHHFEEHPEDSLGPCSKPIPPVPELSPIILTSSGLAGLLLVSWKYRRN